MDSSNAQSDILLKSPKYFRVDSIVKERSSRLFLEIIKDFSSADTPQQVLEILAKNTAKLINIENVIIFSVKKGHPEIRIAVNHFGENIDHTGINYDVNFLKETLYEGSAKTIERSKSDKKIGKEGYIFSTEIELFYCAPIFVEKGVKLLFYFESGSINRNRLEEIKDTLEILAIQTANSLRVMYLSNKKDKILYKLYESNKMLAAANSKIEDAQRLKEEFLSQVSHELRTPLNTIINCNDLIKEEFSEHISEETVEYFNAIEIDSKRLIRTVDSILNMAQLKSSKCSLFFEEFDVLSELISPVLSEFEIELENKGLKFLFEDCSTNKRIYADRYSVTQVLNNIVDNAIKFTSAGYIKMMLYNEEDYLCISIKDTGKGISQEYMSQLFKPFSQEDQGFERKHDGNGLGLAVVKEFIELNQGLLHIESNKGYGSMITVKLKSAAVKEGSAD